MATHAVELVVKRFYKVYVEDENGSMTNEEIEAIARQQLLDDDNPDSSLDAEMNEIEPQDIITAQWEYDF